MNYGTIAGTWDEDLDSRPPRPTPIIAPILDRRQTDQSTTTLTPSDRYPAHTTIEETPLLHRTTSLSFQRPSYTQLGSDAAAPTTPRLRPLVRRGSQISTLSRISETGISTKGRHLSGGQSTFGQTVRIHFPQVFVVFSFNYFSYSMLSLSCLELVCSLNLLHLLMLDGLAVPYL